MKTDKKPIIIIAAVLGIIAAIVVFARVWDNTHVSEEEYSRALDETVNELSKDAAEARQNYDDLQAAFDKYDELVEELENCTPGSIERDRAQQAVNDQVLYMIERFPELKEYVRYK